MGGNAFLPKIPTKSQPLGGPSIPSLPKGPLAQKQPLQSSSTQGKKPSLFNDDGDDGSLKFNRPKPVVNKQPAQKRGLFD